MRLLLLTLLLTGCSGWQLTGVFSNQGVIGAGDNRDNTMEMDIEQHVGDRELTKEEVERAKKGYERGKRDALKLQASLAEIRGAFKTEWESNISRKDFKKKHPKLDPVHRDLITIAHLIWRKVPEFKFFQCARDLEQQKRNIAKGVSQTMKSRHLRLPTQACDVRSTRKAKPFVNGKRDIYDVEYLGYFQAWGESFGMVLENYPCRVFASKVRRVMRWKTIRDLFHWEINPRRECQDGYGTKYNEFS